MELELLGVGETLIKKVFSVSTESRGDTGKVLGLKTSVMVHFKDLCENMLMHGLLEGYTPN